MKKTILTIMLIAAVVAMTACGGGNSNKKAADNTSETKKETKSGASLEEMKEAGYALKYKTGDGTDVIYTRKGSNSRLDLISSDDSHWIGIEAYIKGDGYTGYEYEYGEWRDDSYTGRQMANNYYYSSIQDLTKYFINNGYAKSGTVSICGKTCDVYAGQLTERLKVAVYDDFDSTQAQGEIAVWNGLTMRLTLNGKVRAELVAISNNVPDKAFTKTTEITWIK